MPEQTCGGSLISLVRVWVVEERSKPQTHVLLNWMNHMIGS